MLEPEDKQETAITDVEEIVSSNQGTALQDSNPPGQTVLRQHFSRFTHR